MTTELMRAARSFPQARIRGRPRDSCARAAQEDEAPRPCPARREPRDSERPAQSPAGARAKLQWYLCVLLLVESAGTARAQPFRWVLRHLSGDEAVRETALPAGSPFEFKLRDLFPPQMGFPDFGDSLWQTYWCPASNPGKSYCKYPGYGYCGYWGCETIVTSDRWRPPRPDRFLRVEYAPGGCRPPRFSVDRLIYLPPDGIKHTCRGYAMTVLQPEHHSWAAGNVWTVFVRADRDYWVNVQILRLAPAAPRLSASPPPSPSRGRS